MRDLKCGKRDCKYNEAYCCNANCINVAASTDCLTYEKTASDQKGGLLFEAGIEFAPRDYSVDTCVDCEAKCVFNRENKCIANGITVLGESEAEALCVTFIRD